MLDVRISLSIEQQINLLKTLCEYITFNRIANKFVKDIMLVYHS